MLTKITSVIFLLLTSSIALPCSFAPGYEVFLFSKPNEQGIAPDTPELTGYNFKRGYNDGNFASCSDAGVLNLYFKQTHHVGYLFEPIGKFEDKLFPDDVVTANKGQDHLSFVWLDGSKNTQEAIDLWVKVTAYYANGKRSKPIKIRLVHVGGRTDA